MNGFTDLGLSDAVVKAFAGLGFDGPTDIQRLAVPVVASGKDIYLSSATGTGKTFAYIAPILSVQDDGTEKIAAIVVTPTHDLAVQIEREFERLAAAAGFEARVVAAIGSIPLQRQMERLASKPRIIVGSMGRIRDLALGGHLDLSACRWAVLDEADRLFENEAIDSSAEFLDSLPATCARVLVSATLPPRTIERSKKWFRNPESVIIDPAEALRSNIEHWCFHSSSRLKLDMLRRFESAVKPERCLLFASTNAQIFTIQKRLDWLGFPAVVLKSDRDSVDRRDAIAEFSSGAARWLITTDLGARGLDLPEVSHVVSFDLPEEPTVYMHRAGRTGRAGGRGISVAIADLVELKRASKIAVRYGFPFICKILDSGLVHDIEPENFFALAEEEESARKEVSLEGSKRRDQRGRGPSRSINRGANPSGQPSGSRPMGNSNSRSPIRASGSDRPPQRAGHSRPLDSPKAPRRHKGQPRVPGSQERETQPNPASQPGQPSQAGEPKQGPRRKRRRRKGGAKDAPASE